MTNTNPSDRNSSSSRKLGFDEFIAIFVAFTSIGGIFWWSLSRQNDGWQFNQLLSTNPSTSTSPKTSTTDLQAALFPTPTATPSPITGGDNEKDAEEEMAGGIPAVISPQDRNQISEDKSSETSVLSEFAPSPVVPVPLPESPPTPTSSPTTPLATIETPAVKKSTIPPPIAFTDIPNNFWGNRFINILSSRGVVGGFRDYTFRPNQPVNRAEFAAMLQKAIEKQVPETPLNFKDITDDFWGRGAIQKGISSGFLKGYPDQNFKPAQKIPRVQVLVALASGLNLPTPENPASVVSIYQDAKDIPKYAVDKVAAATVNQLVVNYPNVKLLAPNKEATRAEVAAMIHQTLVRMKRLDAIQSPYIVKPQGGS